jgi:putative ABC transport system permease protein
VTLDGMRDAFAMALQVPVRNPGRSALTTLGLAIGVSAFIAMVSFGRAARTSVVSQFESLGSNVLNVRAQWGLAEGPPHLLDAGDVQALRRETTTLALVVPVGSSSNEISFQGKSRRIPVRASTPDYLAIRNLELAEGTSFDSVDLAQRSKVCVVGASTRRDLLGDVDPLGQVITIDGKMPCRVIGTLTARGSSITSSDYDDVLYMPLSTYEAQLGLPNGYAAIETRPKQRDLLEAAKAEIIALLRHRHGIPEGGVDDFRVSSPDDVTRVAEDIGGILTALLAGIAAVSLLVGGIGIMNIQLVSVAERTHEIGIRAAIGAGPDQILGQFLAEAIVLAAIGALAGVGLGVGGAMLVAKYMNWPNAVAADVVIGSALFGIAVGTVFGYIPARRAAMLDPIVALRRE